MVTPEGTDTDVVSFGGLFILSAGRLLRFLFLLFGICGYSYGSGWEDPDFPFFLIANEVGQHHPWGSI